MLYFSPKCKILDLHIIEVTDDTYRSFNGRIPVTFHHQTASSKANEKRKRNTEATKRYREQLQKRQDWWKTLKGWLLEETGDSTEMSSLSPELKMGSKELKREIHDLEAVLRDRYLRTLQKMGKLEEGTERLLIKVLHRKARTSQHWSTVI